MKKSHRLIFSKKDIQDYATASGDYNPIHLSEREAQQMGFKTCVVHGMLVMGRVGGIIRTQYGSVALVKDYSMRFQAPVYLDSQNQLEVKFTEQELSFHLYSEDGTPVLKGKAVLSSREEAHHE
ncbi:MaoC family dehydratase [Pseudalkalibacillus sp. A8]|uniref:MaoC family dehydratase n=1 Tax=Pseudalkalibacillus sp. A8 TaxID=3382641 RepID=UPI0038B49C64